MALLAAQFARPAPRPPAAASAGSRKDASGRAWLTCRAALFRRASHCRRPARNGSSREILAPQRGVRHARLGQAGVQIQHSHQAGPLAAPVGHRKNRTAMAHQSGQHVVAVLPHRFADHQRGLGRNVAENAVAVLLAVDKSVGALLVVGVRAFDPAAFTADGLHERLLGSLLGVPAHAIRGEPQIAVRHQVDKIGHGRIGFSVTDHYRTRLPEPRFRGIPPGQSGEIPAAGTSRAASPRRHLPGTCGILRPGVPTAHFPATSPPAGSRDSPLPVPKPFRCRSDRPPAAGSHWRRGAPPFGTGSNTATRSPTGSPAPLPPCAPCAARLPA